MKDVHRIDSARQAAVSQCAAMAERIDELESVVCGGAIGERGDACMSVDGVICETQFRNYGFCIISYFRCFDFCFLCLLVFYIAKF